MGRSFTARTPPPKRMIDFRKVEAVINADGRSHLLDRESGGGKKVPGVAHSNAFQDLSRRLPDLGVKEQAQVIRTQVGLLEEVRQGVCLSMILFHPYHHAPDFRMDDMGGKGNLRHLCPRQKSRHTGLEFALGNQAG